MYYVGEEGTNVLVNVAVIIVILLAVIVPCAVFAIIVCFILKHKKKRNGNSKY